MRFKKYTDFAHFQASKLLNLDNKFINEKKESSWQNWKMSCQTNSDSIQQNKDSER